MIGAVATKEVAAQGAAIIAALGDDFLAQAKASLQWARETFGDNLVVASSMGDEVLVHLASLEAPGVDLLFLDTGYHFSETLAVRDEVSTNYPVNVLTLLPLLSVQEQSAKYGADLWASNPDSCCAMRKVEPLERGLEPVHDRAPFRGAWRGQLRRHWLGPLFAHAGRSFAARASANPIWRSRMTDEPLWNGGEMLTGLSGHFSATHRTPEGQMHGHTWYVTVWFKNNYRSDARCYQAVLDQMLSRLDHTELPDDLTWGEDIARHLACLANAQEVEISRPAERIHARWKWDATTSHRAGQQGETCWRALSSHFRGT